MGSVPDLPVNLLSIRVFLLVLIATFRPPAGTVGGNPVQFEKFSFGSIRIDGVTYEHDVVIDRGRVRRREKKPSKKFREDFGHTPLSIEERIPWKGCSRLVIGTGANGALPVMEEVRSEAGHRGISLVILPTAEAMEELRKDHRKTNAILHVTC
jgi:hypothetical protein